MREMRLDIDDMRQWFDLIELNEHFILQTTSDSFRDTPLKITRNRGY